MDSALQRAQDALDEAIKSWSDTSSLRSIFSEIGENAPPAYLQPQRFSLDESVFTPTTTPNQPNAQLHPEFQQALKQCSSDATIKLNQTLSLLADYAWAVAVADDTVDNVVSLYDYARTEAGLAAARNGNKAVLLGGDISGVQDFIYTIAADKATKSLRGRSVYLQLLTDAIAQWILQKTAMPATNLLYSGGGRFFVIVPDVDADTLDAWRKELGAFLLNVHDGELYVALGTTPINPDPKADFAPTFRAVNESINADKRRRFATLEADEIYKRLFQAQGHRGNEDDVCAICGYMGEVGFSSTSDDEGRILCLLCESTIILGQRLHHAQYICRTTQITNLGKLQTRATTKAILDALGLYVEVCKNASELDKTLKQLGPQVHVQLIRSADGLDDLRQKYPQASFEFRPIVNVTPFTTDEGTAKERVKFFDEFAKTSEGIKRFGVLRMDVDDLGDIFAHSLKNSSLAKVATLSATLARFFEGWVGEICRSEQAAERVYSVYSGGDDLFLVGSWDVLPTIAHTIQHDLQRYSGGNPMIHVSAGLTLHSEKFPLYQAAKQAADALDQAKSAPERNGTNKNALNFLDQTIVWEKFEQITSYQQRLQALIQTDKILTNAVLQTLMELYTQYRQGLKRRNKTNERQFFFGPWIWRGKYQLHRINDKRNIPLIAEIDHNLLNGVEHPANISLRTIEQLGLAARWTQLLIRKGDRNARD